MQLTKHITRSSTVAPSPRLAQVLGMFDVPMTERSDLSWDVDITLPDQWNVGVIVGPSGCGKTTIARELLGNYFVDRFHWPAGRSILDGFPLQLTVKQVVGLLASVGFSSPPAWVRPFESLSNGQQFRVNLARALADSAVDGQIRVVDEYSSVVDRTVARIGSAAVAATVRRLRLQFVAVTCHYDVLDWLDPDWVYEPHTNQFRVTPREASSDARGSQRRRRPPVELEIVRTDRSAWDLFKPHHYLSASLNPAAACYVGHVDGQPAAFTAVLPFPHPTASGWREHRTVCLPDYQGIGLGNAMSEFIAGVYKSLGRPYTSTTSHPAMIYHRAKSPLWTMTRKPGLAGGTGKRFSMMRKTAAIDRITAGFRYVGPSRTEEARGFGLRHSLGNARTQC
jgi:energy-coupling factor transporter ATP-binding protein EcfA2/GNAT superfamily N-acetyltransferase